MTTTIHLSGPAEVLTVLPYQLGFHPADSLVVVSLHGTRMGLVQRIDLPPSEHSSLAVAAMIAPLRQDLPESVILIAFEDHEGDSRLMMKKMAGACRGQGVAVAGRIAVRGGRWFDLACDKACCPPEGLPLPAPGAVPAVVEFVGREICPLPDRSALAELLEPKSPIMSLAVSRFAREWSQLRLAVMDVEAAEAGEPDLAAADAGERDVGSTRCPGPGRDLGDLAIGTREVDLHGFRAKELAVWSRVLCDEDGAVPMREVPPRDLAVLAVSLTDVHLRDALIARLCPGTLPREQIDPILFAQVSRALPQPPRREGEAGELAQVIGRQRIERRLCELCAALPDAWAASALTVLASFTWWRGDGALTRVALDRALRTNPHYRLAQLLERMVDLAIRPERVCA